MHTIEDAIANGDTQDPEEYIGVKQRELVDKILTRYPGAFTVFRELLQNADDAHSSAVEIRFESEDYIKAKDTAKDGPRMNNGSARVLPDLKKTVVDRWKFKNNGKVFTEDDWRRLKNIADGNPDENKVGAFGVGFYILFSVAEEPKVSSGGITHRFRWEKDNMRARKIDDTAEPSEWTTFDVILKDKVPFAKMFEFMRFLSSSIVFMSHLSTVTVYFDDIQLASIIRNIGSRTTVALPPGLKCTAPAHLMELRNVKSASISIEAKVLSRVYESWSHDSDSSGKSSITKPKSTVDALFSEDRDGYEEKLESNEWNARRKRVGNEYTENVQLRVFTADVEVIADEAFADELKSRIKKRPPKELSYDLIFVPKDAHDSAVAQDENHPFPSGSVFQELRTRLDGAKRYFNSADWNKELMYIGGLLSRAVYEIEMSKLEVKWSNSDANLVTNLREQTMHLTRFFTFQRTTPSRDVGSEFRKAFFTCSEANEELLILSNLGIRKAKDIRIPDSKFSFMRNQATLPASNFPQRMQAHLMSLKIVKPINLGDVLTELKSRPLTEVDMLNCLNWWVLMSRGCTNAQNDQMLAFKQKIVNYARIIRTLPPNDVIPLSKIQTYLDRQQGVGRYIPASDGPFPPNMLPPSISIVMSSRDLFDVFGWKELSVVAWVEYIVKSGTMGGYAKFDALLSCLSQSWDQLPIMDQQKIRHFLGLEPCIQTTHGLCMPHQAYAGHLSFYRGVPIVQGSQFDERILPEIGVRCSIETYELMEKMQEGDGLDLLEVLHYLRGKEQELTPNDRDILRSTLAFSSAPRRQGPAGKFVRSRHRLTELYKPETILYEMGLPILEWPMPDWNDSGLLETFIVDLGLQEHPSLDIVVHLCASPIVPIRVKALQYLLKNMKSIYDDEYDLMKYLDIAFIPAIKGSKEVLGTPAQVVTDHKWSSLGFYTPTDAMTAKGLRLQDRPPTSALIDALERNPPPTFELAKHWFSLLAEAGDFTDDQSNRLATMPIIPIPSNQRTDISSISMISPSKCFLDSTNISEAQKRLFMFVDFGESGNRFLRICKTKDRPNTIDIAEALVNDPPRFFESTGCDMSLFLSELRKIALEYEILPQEIVEKMKTTPCLISTTTTLKLKLLKFEKKPQLKRPEEIVIADDIQTERLFAEHLWICPKEDKIEEFYSFLGSQRLSQLLEEQIEPEGTEKSHISLCRDVKHRLGERLDLFLQGRDDLSEEMKTFAEEQLYVRTCKKINVHKALKSTNGGSFDVIEPKTVTPSAAARFVDDDIIELWILEDNNSADRWDKYEVAVSMCRLICKAPKVHDALLLHTILSTDLDTLERRGFDVERIRNEKEKRKQEKEKHRNEKNASKKISDNFTTMLTKHIFSLMKSSAQKSPNGLTTTVVSGDVSSKMREALLLCRQEQGATLKNKNFPDQDFTVENADKTCHKLDITGELRHVGTIDNIRIYVKPIKGKSKAPDSRLVESFIKIITVIGTTFGLDMSVFHIFYDATEPDLVGFNRKYCIYLNIKHYEDKHYNGGNHNPSDPSPYISWANMLTRCFVHTLIRVIILKFRIHSRNCLLLVLNVLRRLSVATQTQLYRTKRLCGEKRRVLTNYGTSGMTEIFNEDSITHTSGYCLGSMEPTSDYRHNIETSTLEAPTEDTLEIVVTSPNSQYHFPESEQSPTQQNSSDTDPKPLEAINRRKVHWTQLVSNVITPVSPIPTKIMPKPISASNIKRYERGHRIRRKRSRLTILSGTKNYVDTTEDRKLPDGWVSYTHPEGALYFFYPEKATVILNANVAFLAIPNVTAANGHATPAQVISYASTFSSIGAVMIGLLLVRQNRTKGREDANEAVSFMTRLVRSTFGKETLAILYSLPYALLIMLFFVAALASLVFQSTNAVTRSLIGSITGIVSFFIMWCIVTSWDEASDFRKRISELMARVSGRRKRIYRPESPIELEQGPVPGP
ncbi:hypothetical protein BDQ12DRAFT_739250 [Crucibulum laeve]|uniref:Sacsin/Nov domain-containing protein n=1 Tax=Crucibulum laeve TaxID=68775 RepID=A0A5C3LJ40_9AGAR|nr:hypothetical protein BDQ12DRAFT_739250 [Crucibulum laeve]